MDAMHNGCNTSNGALTTDCRRLVDLPDDMLKIVLLTLCEDDYHMLTLPLVCTTFRALCLTPALRAGRIASRLRLVLEVLKGHDLRTNVWAIGHAWGALHAARDYLRSHAAPSDGLRELAAIGAHGSASLRMLSNRCACVEPVPLEHFTAEGCFLDAERTRLARVPPEQRGRSHSGAESADDAAASSAAAALGLDYRGARAAVQKALEAQQQRHLGATCRRNWKLLTPAARSSWQAHADAANDGAQRKHAAVHAMADLARWLSAQLDKCSHDTELR